MLTPSDDPANQGAGSFRLLILSGVAQGAGASEVVKPRAGPRARSRALAVPDLRRERAAIPADPLGGQSPRAVPLGEPRAPLTESRLA
jgi:hypothetical protein